jgi:hypothetical protein
MYGCKPLITCRNSGNPNGRSKGLARFIRESTRDGQEIAEFFLKAFRGELLDDPAFGKVRPDHHVEIQFEAAKWLAERGWGKPTQYVAVDDDHSPQQQTNEAFTYQGFTALPDEEKNQLLEAARIMEKIKRYS